MNETATATLEDLGRDAALLVAGEGAVDRVEVVAGENFFYEPVYVFSFLLDPEHARQQLGLVRTRLAQKLRDELLALGDEHRPVIRLLSQADWDKRPVA